MKKALALAFAAALGGCTLFHGGAPLDQPTLDAQAKVVADAEIVYTGLAKAGAQYIHCGEPTYAPCIVQPKPDVVTRIRQLDAAAYAALTSARARVTAHEDAASYVAILSAAIVSFTAYEVSTPVQGGHQ